MYVRQCICVCDDGTSSCKQTNSNRAVMHREDEEAREVYRKRHGQQEGRGKRGRKCKQYCGEESTKEGRPLGLAI